MFLAFIVAWSRCSAYTLLLFTYDLLTFIICFSRWNSLNIRTPSPNALNPPDILEPLYY